LVNSIYKKLKMKKINLALITSILLHLVGNLTNAQDVHLEWAKQMGSSDSNYSTAITVDNMGNVYTTGTFQGTIDFDPGPGVFNLTSIDVYNGGDIFIQKLDASGNFIWAKKMGGVAWDKSNSIAVDNFGNVYTTGAFIATVDFDPGPGTLNLVSVSFDDIFIQKLDASGNLLWVKQMGGVNC